jgi:hypothetical protein
MRPEPILSPRVIATLTLFWHSVSVCVALMGLRSAPSYRHESPCEVLRILTAFVHGRQQIAYKGRRVSLALQVGAKSHCDTLWAPIRRPRT